MMALLFTDIMNVAIATSVIVLGTILLSLSFDKRYVHMHVCICLQIISLIVQIQAHDSFLQYCSQNLMKYMATVP